MSVDLIELASLLALFRFLFVVILCVCTDACTMSMCNTSEDVHPRCASFVAPRLQSATVSCVFYATPRILDLNN